MNIDAPPPAPRNLLVDLAMNDPRRPIPMCFGTMQGSGEAYTSGQWDWISGYEDLDPKYDTDD